MPLRPKTPRQPAPPAAPAGASRRPSTMQPDAGRRTPPALDDPRVVLVDAERAGETLANVRRLVNSAASDLATAEEEREAVRFHWGTSIAARRIVDRHAAHAEGHLALLSALDADSAGLGDLPADPTLQPVPQDLGRFDGVAACDLDAPPRGPSPDGEGARVDVEAVIAAARAVPGRNVLAGLSEAVTVAAAPEPAPDAEPPSDGSGSPAASVSAASDAHLPDPLDFFEAALGATVLDAAAPRGATPAVSRDGSDDEDAFKASAQDAVLSTRVRSLRETLSTCKGVMELALADARAVISCAAQFGAAADDPRAAAPDADAPDPDPAQPKGGGAVPPAAARTIAAATKHIRRCAVCVLNGLAAAEGDLRALFDDATRREDAFFALEMERNVAKQRGVTSQLQLQSTQRELWLLRAAQKLRIVLQRRRHKKDLAAAAAKGIGALGGAPKDDPDEAGPSHRGSLLGSVMGGQPMRQRVVLHLAIDEYAALWEYAPTAMAAAVGLFKHAVAQALQLAVPEEDPAQFARIDGPRRAAGAAAPPSRYPQHTVAAHGPGGVAGAGDGAYFLVLFDDPVEAVRWAVGLQFMLNYLPWPAALVAPGTPHSPLVTSDHVNAALRTALSAQQEGRGVERDPVAAEADRTRRMLQLFGEADSSFDFTPYATLATRLCRAAGAKPEAHRVPGVVCRGLRARMGIHLGTVIEEAATIPVPGPQRTRQVVHVYGDTVMKAALLCRQAHGGEVLLSDAVHDAAKVYLTGTGTFTQPQPVGSAGDVLLSRVETATPANIDQKALTPIYDLGLGVPRKRRKVPRIPGIPGGVGCGGRPTELAAPHAATPTSSLFQASETVHQVFPAPMYHRCAIVGAHGALAEVAGAGPSPTPADLPEVLRPAKAEAAAGPVTALDQLGGASSSKDPARTALAQHYWRFNVNWWVRFNPQPPPLAIPAMGDTFLSMLEADAAAATLDTAEAPATPPRRATTPSGASPISALRASMAEGGATPRRGSLGATPRRGSLGAAANRPSVFYSGHEPPGTPGQRASVSPRRARARAILDATDSCRASVSPARLFTPRQRGTSARRPRESGAGDGADGVATVDLEAAVLREAAARTAVATAALGVGAAYRTASSEVEQRALLHGQLVATAGALDVARTVGRRSVANTARVLAASEAGERAEMARHDRGAAEDAVGVLRTLEIADVDGLVAELQGRWPDDARRTPGRALFTPRGAEAQSERHTVLSAERARTGSLAQARRAHGAYVTGNPVLAILAACDDDDLAAMRTAFADRGPAEWGRTAPGDVGCWEFPLFAVRAAATRAYRELLARSYDGRRRRRSTRASFVGLAAADGAAPGPAAADGIPDGIAVRRRSSAGGVAATALALSLPPRRCQLPPGVDPADAVSTDGPAVQRRPSLLLQAHQRRQSLEGTSPAPGLGTGGSLFAAVVAAAAAAAGKELSGHAPGSLSGEGQQAETPPPGTPRPESPAVDPFENPTPFDPARRTSQQSDAAPALADARHESRRGTMRKWSTAALLAAITLPPPEVVAVGHQRRLDDALGVPPTWLCRLVSTFALRKAAEGAVRSGAPGSLALRLAAGGVAGAGLGASSIADWNAFATGAVGTAFLSLGTDSDPATLAQYGSDARRWGVRAVMDAAWAAGSLPQAVAAVTVRPEVWAGRHGGTTALPDDPAVLLASIAAYNAAASHPAPPHDRAHPPPALESPAAAPLPSVRGSIFSAAPTPRSGHRGSVSVSGLGSPRMLPRRASSAGPPVLPLHALRNASPRDFVMPKVLVPPGSQLSAVVQPAAATTGTRAYHGKTGQPFVVAASVALADLQALDPLTRRAVAAWCRDNGPPLPPAVAGSGLGAEDTVAEALSAAGGDTPPDADSIGMVARVAGRALAAEEQRAATAAAAGDAELFQLLLDRLAFGASAAAAAVAPPDSWHNAGQVSPAPIAPCAVVADKEAALVVAASPPLTLHDALLRQAAAVAPGPGSVSSTAFGTPASPVSPTAAQRAGQSPPPSLAWPALKAYFASVLTALAAAHGAGVAHGSLRTDSVALLPQPTTSAATPAPTFVPPPGLTRARSGSQAGIGDTPQTPMASAATFRRASAAASVALSLGTARRRSLPDPGPAVADTDAVQAAPPVAHLVLGGTAWTQALVPPPPLLCPQREGTAADCALCFEPPERLLAANARAALASAVAQEAQQRAEQEAAKGGHTMRIARAPPPTAASFAAAIDRKLAVEALAPGAPVPALAKANPVDPALWSPEAAAATDMWGLGVAMYAAFSGTYALPFAASPEAAPKGPQGATTAARDALLEDIRAAVLPVPFLARAAWLRDLAHPDVFAPPEDDGDQDGDDDGDLSASSGTEAGCGSDVVEDGSAALSGVGLSLPARHVPLRGAAPGLTTAQRRVARRRTAVQAVLLGDLLLKLLAFHPADRLAAAEALRHPFFTDLPAPGGSAAEVAWAASAQHQSEAWSGHTTGTAAQVGAAVATGAAEGALHAVLQGLGPAVHCAVVPSGGGTEVRLRGAGHPTLTAQFDAAAAVFRARADAFAPR